MFFLFKRRFLFTGLWLLIMTSPMQSMALPEQYGGLKGYISANIDSPPSDYGFGVSYYVSTWALLKKPIANFQIGLPSTWITPNNSTFNQPLCPSGTTARDNWSERGPYYQDVFQTIEGGFGFWVNTQFTSAIPKYRMNATADCYTKQMISSPGWGFTSTTALSPDLMGIAQLSNHILVPPDGLTFTPQTQGEVMGIAWMALPLNFTPASSRIISYIKTTIGSLINPNKAQMTQTGDQTWTLFINAQNFKGPIAFYIPDYWSRLSDNYKVIVGRGLDAQPAIMNGGAMEFNTVPYFEATDVNNINYSKIPQLQFPVDENGQTLLMEGIYFYSKQGIYTPLKNALNADTSIPTSFNIDTASAWIPTCHANPLHFTQGNNIELIGIDEIVKTFASQKNGRCLFGLQWSAAAKGLADFPSYFMQQGDKRTAIDAEKVPAVIQLTSQEFIPAFFGNTYQVLDKDAQTAWNQWASDQLISVKLNDGSNVQYRWYKFVDQPSLQNLHLTPEQKNALQAMIVKLHKAWATDNAFMPAPPNNSTLVNVDNVLLVTPPAGLEYGYVPIVTNQGMK